MISGTLPVQNESYLSKLSPQKRFFSFLLKQKTIPLPEEHERKPFGFKDANFISRLFFWWVTPVLNVGYRRTLHAKDLFKLTKDLTVEYRLEQFKNCFESRLEYHRRRYLKKKLKNHQGNLINLDELSQTDDFKMPKFMLVEVMLIVFRKDLLIAVFFGFACCLGFTLAPFASKKLIQFVELKALGSDISIGKGIGYAFATALLILISGITAYQFEYFGSIVGTQARSVLTQLILAKNFKLSPKSRIKYPPGSVTSLISTDLSRVEIAFTFQVVLVAIPIPMGVSIAILIVNIGVSALISIAIFIIFLGGIGYFSKLLYAYRDVLSLLTDTRVGIMREIISNLKMIKFYNWEFPYWKSLTKVREEESNFVFKVQAIRSLVMVLSMSLTGVVTMIAFLVLYAFERHIKDAGSMFSSVQSFQAFGMLVFFIPQALSSVADLFMAAKRAGEFLTCEEFVQNENYITLIDEKDDCAIKISNAQFEWQLLDTKDEDSSNFADEEESANTATKLLKLMDINLQIFKSQFIAVTGLIGSGKSSFLNAISGNMTLNEGNVVINGSLLLSGDPWIQNATIRENILFGITFNKHWYDSVVFACCLQDDLKNLEAGDFTEVGEKGMTLSGGQKARIALARAVYASYDIILLDDVLSAVDVKVGQHIIEHCVFGLLKEKTLVLATHQLSLVDSADKIIFMNGDGTMSMGTKAELALLNPSFARLNEFSATKETEDDSDSIEQVLEEVELLVDDKSDRKHTQLKRRNVHREDTELDEEIVYEDIDLNKDITKGKIIEEEERAVNRLKAEVYITYIKEGTKQLTISGFFVILLFLAAISLFCQLFMNTWLSFWISRKFEDRSDSFYIGFYVMFVLLWVIFSVIENVYLAAIFTKSSKNLTLTAMRKVLGSPMSFIDTNPLGRIINRFSKDTDAMDNEIGPLLILAIEYTSTIIGSIILNIVYLPWIAMAIPGMFIFFFAVSNYYQASSREIRRQEALMRSFAFTAHSEILTGKNTILNFGKSSMFLETSNELMNNMNESSYMVLACQLWLNVNLESLGFVFVLLIALLCVNRVFHSSASTSGLLLTYTIQSASTLAPLLSALTKVENDMNAVERLCQYALHLKPEKDEGAQQLIEPGWPSNGVIEFQNVSMSYRPGLPLVLRDVSFKASSSERIGVCGRTGAGKSSIMSALYQLVSLTKGKILIDGVDISKLDLNTLRSNLSIIPQDPVLFSGTIRKNLDPFGEFDDSLLWNALSRCGTFDSQEMEIVKLTVAENVSKLHKFHLDQVVIDEGVNYSLGERQLISFARALVRNTKILILDEATSSVDYETDAKIQTTINNEFENVTILCIAHRLRTILHYDKIMTLERGEVKEFDTPINLIRKDEGIFKSMCEKSKITEEDILQS
ncbi:P-loop containing nucleoside triphosphate hydrolase protein [Hyphopichia burtonii NRRL Y-1933]|uniref:p-loop containing nucleoside triphosphate hydrolase protein n=1 Tax=Hyphopichia burtonii NRRL Y-1933 TaxID=984485 RepID=A0A1E4RDJ8_9ASCO|nr:P-loop containing nucleoside triphosphate hydrolase protein [Hyphopichia burtonii NRRL Y-1933]ODV65349.1 P-loop containing nucleoside triphosphate hydrolase protein [Hyphopichia burtonii NRRL Y-1933]